MRIISGSEKGRKLKTLEGEHTRPTAEKVKEALFSIIQFEIEGRRVLDLFAGSGQLGLEALSRGARECVFVDNDKAAMQIIRENAEKCRMTEKCRFFQTDYVTALKRPGEKYDIIIMDPPYKSGFHQNALEIISGFDMLAINGIIIVETEVGTELPESIGSLNKLREYRYGRTMLTTYRRDGD